MQNITRRSALFGTAAAVAVTATAGAAPALVSDPHAKWIEVATREIQKANIILGKVAKISETIETELANFPAVISGYHKGAPLYLQSIDNPYDLDVIAARRLLIRANGKSETKAAELMATERATIVDQFKARVTRRAELEKATGLKALEAQALVHIRRANDLEFKAADTPAKTLEGVFVQATLLATWTEDGAPRRDPKINDLGMDERELSALANRVADGIAALAGSAR